LLPRAAPRILGRLVRDLPLASPASLGLDPRVLDGPLTDLLARHRTGAAALVVRGHLVWERAFAGYDVETRFDTYSIGKAFTAAAIGLLYGDGAIMLDEPAHRFLPEWAGGARRAITVRHLLTMTSGLALDFRRFTSARDAHAATLAWPLVHHPGRVWCYEQATAHALLVIAERVAKRDALDLMRERVLDPIGARDVGWRRDASGRCLGWRSVLASARDLARFGLLLLRGGAWEGRAVLDPRFVAAMTRVDPVTRAAIADPPRDDTRRASYGFLAFVNESGLWPGVSRGAFALLGAFGNACLIDPEHEVVFVRLVTPEAATRADGTHDEARFGNALDVADHGTARLFRAVLAAFRPETSFDALRRRLEHVRLDALASAHTRLRRRGLML
jgi:CubicO group peptidase (beta-lactamase class C family)